VPRPRKKALSWPTDAQITSSNVDDLFRAATKEPPWPEIENCQHIADVMNANWGVGMSNPDIEKKKAEARKASAGLLAFIEECRDESDQGYSRLPLDLANLKGSLEKSQPYFAASVFQKDWVPMAFVLAEVAAVVLSEIGRGAGRSRDSVLVKFLSLALERMGFVGATPANLEDFLKKHDVWPGA
jgi:hypothetical protein